MLYLSSSLPFPVILSEYVCPICMHLYLQAFPPNIYFSCLFMSHAYPVQFGFNSSSFFPVLFFTSLISKGIQYQTRPPTLSALTSLQTGFCRALLSFSHHFQAGPLSFEVTTLQCSPPARPQTTAAFAYILRTYVLSLYSEAHGGTTCHLVLQ